MKLYTTLGTGKLAGLLKMDEEELVEDLLVMKGAGRNVRWMDGLGGLLEGEEVANSDLDLLIDDVRPAFLSPICQQTRRAAADTLTLFCIPTKTEHRDSDRSPTRPKVRRLLPPTRRESSGHVREHPESGTTHLEEPLAGTTTAPATAGGQRGRRRSR